VVHDRGPGIQDDQASVALELGELPGSAQRSASSHCRLMAQIEVKPACELSAPTLLRQ